jgi:anti-sigma B factor antagonist/stage II sporulation protein AA (anti-sigma F factor antagonist)
MTLAQVDVEHHDKGLIVRIRGEVDLSNAGAVRGDILAALERDMPGLVLDLTETTYLDSSGVRLLFELSQLAHDHGQRCALVVTHEALVRRVLLLTKLDDAVPLHDDVDSALAELAGP